MSSIKLKSVAVAGLIVLAASVSGGAAQAASTSETMPTTTCSDWQSVGDSTVSARTCLTVKEDEDGEKAKVRGAVQVMNTGTETVKVKATWTLSVARGKSGKPANIRTVTVRRAVPATGEAFRLSGRANHLDAAGLAAVQATIVVVAPKTGVDKIRERTSARL